MFHNFVTLYFSIVYQKELTKFNEEPIFASLAEYMLCDKEKLVKQVKKLIDSEDVKIAKPIERYKNVNNFVFYYLSLLFYDI